MKKQEIKKLKKTEIEDNINKFKKDLFNLRFQKINGQLNSFSMIKHTKKTIARLKTLLKGNSNA